MMTPRSRVQPVYFTVTVALSVTTLMQNLPSAATAAASTTMQRRLARQLLRGLDRLPPRNASGGAVQVEIGVYINYIYAISEQTMDYSLSMYLRQQWRDTRLAFDPLINNNSSRIKMPDLTWNRIWVPDVIFRNEQSASFHAITTPNRLLSINSDGIVWYVKKVTARLECPMLLHKYPLDTQRCPMTFSSFDYPADQLVLKWFDPKQKAVQFDPGGEDRSQFTIIDFKLDDCSYYNSTSDYPPGSYSCLQAVFIISRNMGFFLIQYYIPSVLLVILSWVSFWISVEAVVARVNIGLLTVLALTTQTTTSQLPRVSYIKAIDVWMSTCLVFAFASLIEFALVNVWTRREIRQQAKKSRQRRQGQSPKLPEDIKRRHQTRRQTTLTLPSLSMLTVPETSSLTTSTGPLPSPSGGRRLSMTTRRLSIQLPLMVTPRPVERASSIDVMSRVLFPVTFLIFNLMYWSFYVFFMK